MPETTYLGAITRALAEEMRRDPAVYVIGEDVAEGGPYGATRGLAEEFGTNRVRNTPISESTVTGLAIGAAIAGLRPVIEIMFIDFITLALDQLVNQGAKTHYMSGGQLRVPMVVRTQGGAGARAGAQHSQSLEGWLTHVPGLKVVMPSDAADAAGLLKSAIRDDNPVVVVEHNQLYFRRFPLPDRADERGPGQAHAAAPAASASPTLPGTPDELEAVPIGRAIVRRPGRDATVVATSRMVAEALQAAEALAAEGIEVEVVDPRTLVPLDAETIIGSLARTHRLVVAHEAVQQMGFGAEIVARLQEEAFDHLDAPITRVGAPFTPIPVSPPLEQAYLPGKAEIERAVRATLGLAQPQAELA